jgi:hypothetical protein
LQSFFIIQFLFGRFRQWWISDFDFHNSTNQDLDQAATAPTSGCITPACALWNTSLLDRLRSNGFVISIVHSGPISAFEV